MVFSSGIFLFLFLPIVLILYYNPIVKNRNFKNILLFAVSILFYAWGEHYFVLVMLLSIIVNWYLGLAAEKYRDSRNKIKGVLIAAVIYNIGMLFVFKYLTAITMNIASAFDNKNSIIKISLPIGISFFTFQALSYVTDVYRGHGKAQKNPLNVGLYIAFFPQLIAGPIVRYETVAEEILSRRENIEDFTDGTVRFIKGLAKKIIIANNAALLADTAFGYLGMNELTMPVAWLGAIAYTIQIFFDFSGYSDMAIGLGKMFGFHFRENFDFPYISCSITEFWRRWHISLGTWFRDYVYIPLGGNRVGKARHIFNIFVVWTLTGIWHGANRTFLVWGLMYFVLLIAEKSTGIAKKRHPAGIVYTMFFVVLGWVIFRSNDMASAVRYLRIMFTPDFSRNNYALYLLSSYKVFLAAGIILSMPVGKIAEKLAINKTASDIVYTVWIGFIFILSVSYLAKSAYNPFIYFNF
ncbi:MAG: MBOAT family protein [Oscillospiraceae bacterium]|nr:MBOAT family protein [Oscillospiraceae bacterium]